jgi:glyoxylase-like metal-dependent hydrolase (beta-lactamase superfamily II)
MSEARSETGKTLSWDVGAVRVTRIVECDLRWSVREFLQCDAAALAPHAGWTGPYLSATADEAEVLMSVHSFGVEADGRKLVVDTCVGNGKDFGTIVPAFNGLRTAFLDDLAAAGFGPGDVDTVICTHLHMDHVGWNTIPGPDGTWVPTFPDARYVMTQLDIDHWRGIDAQWNAFGASVAPVLDAGLVDAVEPDHRVGPSVGLIPTPGHTPGHVSVLIESGDRQAVITGDMVHSPLELVEPTWGPRGEHDPEAADRTRHAMAARVTDRGVLVLGTHFPTPTAGYVETVDGRPVFRGA